MKLLPKWLKKLGPVAYISCLVSLGGLRGSWRAYSCVESSTIKGKTILANRTCETPHRWSAGLSLSHLWCLPCKGSPESLHFWMFPLKEDSGFCFDDRQHWAADYTWAGGRRISHSTALALKQLFSTAQNKMWSKQPRESRTTVQAKKETCYSWTKCCYPTVSSLYLFMPTILGEPKFKHPSGNYELFNEKVQRSPSVCTILGVLGVSLLEPI